jgi:hypothetical protein
MSLKDDPTPEESGEPLPRDVELGLRGMAMQADFAAGLMKAGGLT